MRLGITVHQSHSARYWQLSLLILAAGTIYPIPYIRQNFENSMLETFRMTQAQLGECSSLLGLMFFLTYAPSGWLADRFKPNKLLAFSMAGTGLLALWLATAPPIAHIKVIFLGLGITSGLTLWGSLIKTTSLLAPHDQQGRYFGLLESGRGIVEALLATIALALFAFYLEELMADTSTAMTVVINFYGGTALALSPLILLFLQTPERAAADPARHHGLGGTWADITVLIGNQSVWLSGLVILIGYQLFWVTYSFAGLLESVFGLSAITVGTITVARLWMRPIGPLVAGFLGDKFHAVRFLSWLLLAAAIALVSMPLLPLGAGLIVLLPIVLIVSLLTFGIRGIYWATLDDCNVSAPTRGLAIGLISVLAYTPDIYVPMVQALCLSIWEGKAGYAAYYSVFASTGVLGFWAARRLVKISEQSSG